MIYLLAKFTLLFLLASALGFFLGYWWSRRSFVDVSESYQDLRKAAEQTDAANWEQLWKRLDSLPEPKETDLSSVFARLDALPEPKETDLSPVFERLDSVHSAVGNIPTPDTVDLAPVQSRLESLGGLIANIPAPAPQQEVDLQPVQNELSSIRGQISGLPKVETHEPVDLAPLVGQVDALEKRVSRLPQPEKVDLKPIDGRLRSIETEIGRLGKRLSRPVQSSAKRTRKPAQPKKKSGEPTVLSAAIYGKKDDLKSISGVGPKLEHLLNKNGVYYFWQVATWSHSDIDIIDRRLDVFKGRISRDDWVSQAKQLRKSPEAARMPSE